MFAGDEQWAVGLYQEHSDDEDSNFYKGDDMEKINDLEEDDIEAKEFKLADFFKGVNTEDNYPTEEQLEE
jgi:hypothetical protein